MGDQPILIIGAGISGLVLAQHLRKENIPFRLFERDTDLVTRSVGWGLTLSWSLPALRSLLPDDLVERLPEAYVDRAAIEAGAVSTTPYFNLSTGELYAQSPKTTESQRIRVLRQKLRELLATNIDIEWKKSFSKLQQDHNSVTATFDDGTSASGRLLVACDGANSRVKRELFPDSCDLYQIPVRTTGFRLNLSRDKAASVLALDPLFFLGTNPKNDSFVYMSLLEAPQPDSDPMAPYVYQMCVSWPYRKGFLGSESPIEVPATNKERLQLLKQMTSTWTEPFRSFIDELAPDEEIKYLEPHDYPPERSMRTRGRATLMGDALHAMAMYRGEGANHTIVDVLDLVESMGPLLKTESGMGVLRESLDKYEETVIDRARTGVLASRQACLDAHDWSRISLKSPLLAKREMRAVFEEFVLAWQ